jgi:hypothetical protein
MASQAALEADPSQRGGWRSRLRGAFSGSREGIRLAYRDPGHASERLTQLAVARLAAPSREWAESALRRHPDTTPEELAEALRLQSAKIARVDGAVSGTPFYLALIPGYASYLWQEGRMTLRMAALYGHDPGDLRAAAEILALRGVHPTVEAAEAALLAVGEKPPPPVTARRPLRTWIDSGRALLVFGGFLSPSADKEPGRSWWRISIREMVGLAVAGGIWVTTWVFPVTFMIVMAWGCETHARQLGRRAHAFYSGEAGTPKAAIAEVGREHEHGHTKRQLLRGAAITLSIVIPIAFIAYVDHVRKTVGVNWLGALGALVALSLVIAAAVYGSRR